jgi:hypothetical protein
MRLKQYLVFLIILTFLSLCGCTDDTDGSLEGEPIGPSAPAGETESPDEQPSQSDDASDEPAEPAPEEPPADDENSSQSGAEDDGSSGPDDGQEDGQQDEDVNATVDDEGASDSEEENMTIPVQDDPSLVVQAYLERINDAMDGDDSKFESAYDLVSPHSKKNIAWLSSLSRFRSESVDTYEKYDHGGNLTAYLETSEYGNGYKVYYEYEEGEVYYIVQYIDDLYYIASGSRLGSMYWRLKLE